MEDSSTNRGFVRWEYHRTKWWISSCYVWWHQRVPQWGLPKSFRTSWSMKNLQVLQAGEFFLRAALHLLRLMAQWFGMRCMGSFASQTRRIFFAPPGNSMINNRMWRQVYNSIHMYTHSSDIVWTGSKPLLWLWLNYVDYLSGKRAQKLCTQDLAGFFQESMELPRGDWDELPKKIHDGMYTPKSPLMVKKPFLAPQSHIVQYTAFQLWPHFEAFSVQPLSP